MSRIDRRRFLAAAAALGASAAWAGARAAPSATAWKERRDLYPEGVASGDPQSDSVILWTRRPFADGRAEAKLTVEVADDEAFDRVVAVAPAKVSAASDWTSRVLVGGLKPRREYWYRFTDTDGGGSRIGRTLTAPAANDTTPVRFAFVSCQDANTGAQHAYRRMIFEDRKAAPADRLGFVFHLGDFIYEMVWYPEDRPQGYLGRKIFDIGRYPSGEKIADFHVPTTVEDYRAVYKAYLHDPDLQDARAWFPFVAMWDNHEFSWLGWQSMQVFGGKTRPAQTRKVAANQAWFEFQPARVRKVSGPSLDTFDPPRVTNAPITRFDDNGMGQEPNNQIAINSLVGYRALNYGPHLELIITDQRSYRSQWAMGRPETDPLGSEDFAGLIPEELQEIVDAGRAYDGGKPPATLKYVAEIPNFRRDEPPQTLLGATQKAWFKDRLVKSKATWKVWGSTMGTLDFRADPQNIPAGVGKPWPGAGYAGDGGGSDMSCHYVERAEIYDLVRDHKITGFATVAGDRHSFWAGLSAKALPPKAFEPVGVAFVTGSISSPGPAEGNEHNFPKDHPLRPLFILDRPGSKPEPTLNMLLRHGVRSCFEYQRSGDVEKARALSNPELAPHLSFVDVGGHGYAVVTAGADALETEFVCIPRPVTRDTNEDGGPLLYRVTHRARLWQAGEKPVLEQKVIEGDPKLSI